MAEILILTALSIVVGFPLAVTLHRRDDQPPISLLAVEGAALGLAVFLIVGLGLVRVGRFDPHWVAGVVGGVALLAWGWVVSKRMLTFRHAVTAEGIMLTVLLGLTVFLRQSPIYFIYEIGDMGEYVNRANVLADGGGLIGSFPHLFTVGLALTHLALGEGNTVALLPFLGVLLWALVTATIYRLGLPPWVRITVSAIVAVHVVPVWFSRFPVSEALYTTLLVAAILFLVEALHSLNHRFAVVAGGFVGLLLLTRANGVLLLPIIGSYLFAAALNLDQRGFRIARTFVIVSGFSLFGAYLYNVTYLRRYFVEVQIQSVAGESVLDLLGLFQLERASVAAVVVFVVFGAAVVWLASEVSRWKCARWPGVAHPNVWWLPAALLGAAAVLAAILFLELGGLREALSRYGTLLLALGAIGLAAAVVKTEDRVQYSVGFLAIAIVVVFGALFANRVSAPTNHAFFLYWDRYLYSEVFPGIVLLGALGASAVGFLVFRVVRNARARRFVALIGVLLVGWGLVGPFDTTLKANESVLFEGAYEDLAQLNSIALTDGDYPIVYVGDHQIPEGWIFPNTFRAIALPLSETYGRRVVNVQGRDPFGMDPIPTPDEVHELMIANGFNEVYLIAVPETTNIEWLSALHERGVATSQLGTVEMDIPIIRRMVQREKEQYYRVTMIFDVHLAELIDEQRAAVER
ncbi:MAG: hypothetical protein IH864_03610 [Chloroflexi bacterium]|nr:hypothetical protein [Chloroflexota bacterium]